MIFIPHRLTVIAAWMSVACAHTPPTEPATEKDDAGSTATIRAWDSEDARAAAALEAGQLVAARAGFERALAMGVEQLKQNPGSARIKVRLALSHGRLAFLAARSGQLAEAKRRYEQGLALTDEVKAETPNASPADFLANGAYLAAEQLYGALGRLAKMQGESAEAERRWEQALAIDEAVLKLMSDADTAKRARDLYVALAMLAAESKNYALAQRRFEQGIAIDEQLMREQPTDVELKLHAANLHIGLGLLLNDPQHARQAQVILEAVKANHALSPTSRAKVEYLQQQAAQMLHE